MLYSVYLKDFRVPVNIGIHDFERAGPQDILFNIHLAVYQDGQDDAIETVVDYDFLRNHILELTSDRRFDLQETLCRSILTTCLEQKSVAAARVRTDKPTVYKDADTVGCVMFDKKSDINIADVQILFAD